MDMEINNKNIEQYKKVIQSIKEPYEKKKWPKMNHAFISKKRTATIKKYFKEHTELDLESIQSSKKTTWEKAIYLATFVAMNIPHDNQTKGLKRKNAITLWEYSREVSTGFNCRWHSILLGELLLAIGIKNSFVKCLPEDLPLIYI